MDSKNDNKADNSNMSEKLFFDKEKLEFYKKTDPHLYRFMCFLIDLADPETHDATIQSIFDQNYVPNR